MKKLFYFLLKNRRLVAFFLRIALRTIKKTIQENKKQFEKLEKEIASGK